LLVESQAGWSTGEKKPKLSGEYKPSIEVLRGYNSNRGEFEIEYDNDAEQVLAEMEFKDTDTRIQVFITLGRGYVGEFQRNRCFLHMTHSWSRSLNFLLGQTISVIAT
jgi:hypothetical protein